MRNLRRFIAGALLAAPASAFAACTWIGNGPVNCPSYPPTGNPAPDGTFVFMSGPLLCFSGIGVSGCFSGQPALVPVGSTPPAQQPPAAPMVAPAPAVPVLPSSTREVLALTATPSTALAAGGARQGECRFSSECDSPVALVWSTGFSGSSGGELGRPNMAFNAIAGSGGELDLSTPPQPFVTAAEPAGTGAAETRSFLFDAEEQARNAALMRELYRGSPGHRDQLYRELADQRERANVIALDADSRAARDRAQQRVRAIESELKELDARAEEARAQAASLPPSSSPFVVMPPVHMTAMPPEGSPTTITLEGLPAQTQTIRAAGIQNGALDYLVVAPSADAAAPLVLVTGDRAGTFDFPEIRFSEGFRVPLDGANVRITVPPEIVAPLIVRMTNADDLLDITTLNRGSGNITSDVGSAKPAAQAQASSAEQKVREAASRLQASNELRRIALDIANRDPAKQERGKQAFDAASPQVKAQVGNALRGAHLSAAQIAGDAGAYNGQTQDYSAVVVRDISQTKNRPLLGGLAAPMTR